MSKSFDPVPWFAAGFLCIGAGLCVWWMTIDGTDAGPAVADSVAGDASKPSGRDALPPDSGGGEAKRAGWIPADAVDVVRKEDAGKSAPDGTSCEDRPNPVDLAKQTASQVEAAMRQASALTDSEEAELGEKLEGEAPKADRFKGKWDVPEDRERYGQYVQDLMDHLAKFTSRPGLRYRVHMVRDDSFNAFALPGGVMGVHTGLLSGPNAVRSEAELAMVMAHELAHIERRHPVAAYQYAKMVAGTDAEPAVLVAQMLNMPMSSEYEHEADARGLELATQGQYDPFAACRLWVRDAQDEKAAGGGEKPEGIAGVIGGVLDMGGQVLASHPPSYQRCARTRDKARQINESADVATWYVGERNVKEHVIGPKTAY